MNLVSTTILPATSIMFDVPAVILILRYGNQWHLLSTQKMFRRRALRTWFSSYGLGCQQHQEKAAALIVRTPSPWHRLQITPRETISKARPPDHSARDDMAQTKAQPSDQSTRDDLVQAKARPPDHSARDDLVQAKARLPDHSASDAGSTAPGLLRARITLREEPKSIPHGV